ncbi:hypothetical protein J4414_00130 [Candidatus Woesearchaeota archaeon]|nr:hypothetical protein [Candidatus Woesearchaeota archaeon]
MSRISLRVREKIKEEILRVLFENFPRPLYTKQIADTVLRNDEFTLVLLRELEKKNFINRVRKTRQGFEFSARKQWSLDQKIYSAYKKLT